MKSMLFSWDVIRFMTSNAIVLSEGTSTVGIGMGQPSRVGAVKIAVEKSGNKSRHAVMASDAFFPMPDSIDVAAEAGIKAVIQPGGSIKDREVIEAADKRGIAMVFTGIRHFRH